MPDLAACVACDLNCLEPVGSLNCSYCNTSDRMIILRCLGPDQFFLERVVFPFEQLSFVCPTNSEVELWSHCLGGPELVERLAASQIVCNC